MLALVKWQHGLEKRRWMDNIILSILMNEVAFPHSAEKARFGLERILYARGMAEGEREALIAQAWALLGRTDAIPPPWKPKATRTERSAVYAALRGSRLMTWLRDVAERILGKTPSLADIACDDALTPRPYNPEDWDGGKY